MDNKPKPEKSIRENTLSNQLAQEHILSSENFEPPKIATNPATAAKPSIVHSLKPWQLLLMIATVLVVGLLLFLLFGRMTKKAKTNNVDSVYGTTSLDINGLQSTPNPASSKIVFNGDTTFNGTINANEVVGTFSGDGADLTNLNANNITSGTLNDARLSPNVALLNTAQTFTGDKSFTGAVNLPGSVSINSQTYNFPAGQATGFLKNDGAGNLVWTTSGGSGCVSQCVNNGGDSFGTPISIGTNDSYAMSLRTDGADRLTISPTGSAVFSNTVTATQFFGSGAGLTNINATNITSGTLDSARLPGAVTLQGNTFNGPDQLVQLNPLGYLPSLNGGNLTSLNASFVTSGTLADARLTANVALLDGNQSFIGTNTFTQPVTVNTLTPTSAMTIGATGQNLSLRGNGSTSWTSTTGGFTTTVNFTGVPTGGVTYQFDSAATPGTYTICTTAGGACGGGGSGNVSTPGGTTNAIPKFTAANTIGDSNITDNGTTVTLGGSTVVVSGSELRVNGAAGGYAIDATGDINAGTHLRVGGNIVCDSTGCNASGGGGFYIQNTTSQQNAANFFIQSASTVLPTGTIKALGGQSSDLLQFQSSGGGVIASVYPGGGFNTTDKYYVGGVALASTNLSDTANLARLNSNQTFSGDNIFTDSVTLQNSVDQANQFQVKNAAGTTTILNIDSLTNKVAIGAASASWPLDVTGDINSSTGLRINGVLVCDSSGCTSTSSGGINNGTTTQLNANYNIQSSDVNAVVGVLQGKAGQVSDLFQAQTSAGTPVFKIGQAGLTTINNGITLTGGNQTIQNNTGNLNLTASSTTIALNNTTTITSGDGTGLRYAADYAYQPLSLVSRQYVDNAISGIVVGACPTCFLNGGNSFGITASIGTNDNNTLIIETANTPRITLGTNGGIAHQGSTASGNYSTAFGASLASGDYSFAIGGGTASGQHSFAGGYAVNAITAAGNGSMAFGYSANGAITATGIGSFAGGNSSSTSALGAYSIAYGYGARAQAEATAAFNYSRASGSGATSFGSSLVNSSGAYSIAGGYASSAITSSSNGSLAFGRSAAFTINATGEGAVALGYSQNGAITAAGIGSLAGGDNSSTGGSANFAIAWGTGTSATGAYSAAFNNSVSSSTGSFAINSSTASGIYSFAGGESGTQAYARRSFAFGSNVKSNNLTGEGAIAFGRDTVANGNYGFAAGYGARTSGGDANVAFNYSLASGTGALAMGSTLVTSSGAYSFAGGYANQAITSTSSGSFAFGRTNGGTLNATNEGSVAMGYAIGFNITSAGLGSMAFGASRNGAITVGNAEGSFAGGDNSQVGNGANYSIAYGTGTRATGLYSAAFNNSTASGTGAFSTGSAIAGGVHSFATGYSSGAGGVAYVSTANQGAFAGGYAISYPITSSGIGSMAFGASRNGAITVGNAEGSFAGGNATSVGNGANYSIAYGYGAQANNTYSAAFNNATASGVGAFAIGTSTASGQNSFAGGYFISYGITASGLGSMAFGAGRNGVVTASGEGSFAGGDNSTATQRNAIAFGTGTHATGLYSAAFNNSTASGTGAFSTGNAVASGIHSFATGYGTGSGGIAYPTASGQGALAGGYAYQYAITSGGLGSMAYGMARNGAITTNNAEGSFAGGDNSSVGNGANYSIAFGTGTRANGTYSAAFNNSTASGTGAFSTGNALASGTLSFATGYNTGSGSITSAGEGSFAGGFTANNFSITSANRGSMAFGYALDGSITTNNAAGAFAGGNNTSVGNGANYSIAFGHTSAANGAYSAAFNNSTASGTGAFSSGIATTASGPGAFAAGFDTGAGTITASGNGAMVGGYTTANLSIAAIGHGSYAIGYVSLGSITASGNGSFAGGDGSTTCAACHGSIAYGYGASTTAGTAGAAFNRSTAGADYSFATGYLTTASGSASDSGGYAANGAITASGQASLARGYTTAGLALTSSGLASFATGYTSLGAITAAGTASFAGGDASTTCGACHGGIAYGYGVSLTAGTAGAAFNTATAGHDYAFAANDGTATGQYSTAFGTLTTASGFNSTVFGRKMTVSNNYSFGVSLADATYTVADANTASFMGGYVGIGTVSPGTYSAALAVVGDSYTNAAYVGSTGNALVVRAGNNAAGNLEIFQRADGTTVGSITHDGSNTAFNVASDERLKHDITDTSYSLDTVLALQIHDYKYNNDSTGTTYTGFIAQELQKLFPDAVSVMDPTTGYLGIDYGKLSPLLAKGIQDLNTKVDNLQAQVDSIKGGGTASTTSTSVDVVAELAKANAITMNGDLTVNGQVIIAGNLQLKGENTGVIKIPAGQTRVHMSFNRPFQVAPNVTLTAKGLTKASYAVDSESTTGFDVILESAQDQDTLLNYHAL